MPQCPKVPSWGNTNAPPSLQGGGIGALQGRSNRLLAHLIRTGVVTETGISRRASARRCHRCQLYTVAGLDDDRCALEAQCDPRPLTAAGEATAIVSGLRTFSLTWRGRYELDARTYREIRSKPAGSTPRHDVLAEHQCDLRLPAECFGPSSFPEVRTSHGADAAPPF